MEAWKQLKIEDPTNH